MGYIYCITNKINGKKYVGLTVTTLANRFKEHKSDSKRRKCMPLYRAFNKYGIENFYIEELEEVENDKLSEREIYWIKKLDTFNSKNGYNATLGGQGGRRLYDEKDNQFILECWNKGLSIRDINKQTGIGIHKIASVVGKLPNFKEQTQSIITERIREAKGRRIVQYTRNGDFVKSYDTAVDVQRELGLPSTTQIIACCKKPNYTCHNFLFRYEGDTPPSKDKRYGKRRLVNQYDMNGNYIRTFNTLTEAGKSVNAKAGDISTVCRGKQSYCKGYLWKYADEAEYREIVGEDYE